MTDAQKKTYELLLRDAFALIAFKAGVESCVPFSVERTDIPAAVGAQSYALADAAMQARAK